MNRPYVYRNKPVPGVFQRCRSDCAPRGCLVGHRWAFVIELPPGPDGERRQLGRGGFPSGKAAKEARDDVAKAHRDGLLPDGGRQTLAEWLRHWLEERTNPNGAEEPLRPGTVVAYRSHIENYLIPYLGQVKLADLRAVHITGMFVAIRKQRDAERARASKANQEAERRVAPINAQRRAAGKKRMLKPERVAVPRPFGPMSVRRVRATLSSALTDAYLQGEVTRNVATQIRSKTVRADRRPRPRIWQPEQLGRFLDAVEAGRWAEGESRAARQARRDARLAPMFHLAAFAGLRRGELCGLRWSAVDLKRGRITVDWQRTTAGYQVVEGPPKSDESESTVDIDDETVKVLRAWRRVQLAERLRWGAAWKDTGLVFTREDGSGWHPDFVSQRFQKLVARHRLPKAHLHLLRHTAASLQIAAGVDIAIVSKRLRHSTIGLTNDTYGHLIGSAGKDAAEAAAALVPRFRTRSLTKP